MPAEELLALDRPALLTLIGQTRIEEPGRVLPQVVKIIGQTPDTKERSRLFAALTSLMRDEEILKMAEQLVEAMDQGLMLDTPLLRRIREEGRAVGIEEGRAVGIEEGRAVGIEEGRTEGQAEGRAEGLLEAILDVIAARLDISVSVYRGLERRLSTVSDGDRLRAILQAAIQASDVADLASPGAVGADRRIAYRPPGCGKTECTLGPALTPCTFDPRTDQRVLQISLPEDIPAGPARVVVVIATRQPAQKGQGGTAADMATSSLFGLWGERTDLGDSQGYARKLRARAERRANA